MQIIIFNEHMKRIEHFTNCTWHHVKSYLEINSNVSFIGAINSDTFLDGEILIESSKIFFGRTSQITKLRQITLNFDKDFFESSIDVINSEEYINIRANIIENLIHIYNGGSVDSVPFPMPVTKTIETNSIEFTKEAEQDIQIYSLQQAVDEFISKLE